MSHPLETAAADLRARLRSLKARAPVVPGRHFVPGVWIAADMQNGRIAAEAAPEGLLQIDIKVEQRGRWLSLNCALDRTPLAPGSVLGLTALLSADAPLELGVVIRSGLDGGHRDAVFPDRIAAGPTPCPAVALLPVTADTFPPEPPAWRNLMLNLPFRDLRLTLHDLRLFVLEQPLPAPAEASASA
jgi:hypothetical protein